MLVNVNQVSRMLNLSVRGARGWLNRMEITRHGSVRDGHNQYKIVEVLEAKYGKEWYMRFQNIFQEEMELCVIARTNDKQEI